MPIPYKPQRTKSSFYIPPTLADDYKHFLDHDVPNMVMDFQLLNSWYDQFAEDYEPTYIRGLIYADATKSRYTNTDNLLNFRAAVDSGIKKGDMIVDSSGNIYLFDWDILLQHNNAPTRALRCNASIQFYRYTQQVTDDLGYLIQPQGNKVVSQAIPCNAYRYDGRPEWSNYSGTPGLTPNALSIITLQYNEQTKDINIDDKFMWGNAQYVIIDVNYMGLDVHGTHGVISIQAKKSAGGQIL